MRCIDADALEELFREVIGSIAKKPEMDGNLEHMVRASAMVIEMIKDAPTIEPETQVARDIATIIENEQDMRVVLRNAQAGLICKDCKHYDRHDKRCKKWNHGVERYDYCSRAEWREDGRI